VNHYDALDELAKLDKQHHAAVHGTPAEQQARFWDFKRGNQPPAKPRSKLGEIADLIFGDHDQAAEQADK
jgi:hypothetical protein